MKITEYHPLSTDDADSSNDNELIQENFHGDSNLLDQNIFKHENSHSLSNSSSSDSSQCMNLEEGISIGNNKPFPISRPPTKHRDGAYAIAFLSHFTLILLLSLIEQESLKKSMLSYERAGSISSIVMIVTLLGSFFGAVLAVLVIGGCPGQREALLGCGLIFSTVAKICLGNVLLLLGAGLGAGSRSYSLQLLGVVVLFSAVADGLWYRAARDSLSFTSALIQMTIEVTGQYGVSLFFACATIISCQTCILLWWGAFFTGLVSSMTPVYAQLSVAVMVLSLYWIYQFFQMFVSYVVGGCVLWVFVRPEDEPLDPVGRTLLYMQCALSTSLGSLCKGALLAPLAQLVLAGSYLSAHRPSNLSLRLGALGGRCCCCCCSQSVALARKHHRLALCLCAAYGRTFCRAAEDHVQEFPETLVVCMENCTELLLKSCCMETALLMAVGLALAAERDNASSSSSSVSSWPLLASVCFCLAYCGLSLAVHVYCSAVDALIVAAFLRPDRFAKENQIVFLRFLRTSESALR